MRKSALYNFFVFIYVVAGIPLPINIIVLFGRLENKKKRLSFMLDKTEVECNRSLKVITLLTMLLISMQYYYTQLCSN